MEIKAKCRFDFESVRALTYVSMYKKADPKKRFIRNTVIALVLAAVIVLEMILFFDAAMIWLLCVTLLLLAFECYLYLLLPRIRYRSVAKMQMAENEYLFCDDVLKAFSKSSEYSGEAEMNYSLFIKVYETSEYLFLYQADNRVYIVDKNTVEGGTVGEIRNKLCAFVKEKYIICKY